MAKKLKLNKNISVTLVVALLTLLLIVLLARTIQTYKAPINIAPPSEIPDFSSEGSQSNNVIKMLFLGDIMTARTIGQAISNNEDPFMYMKETFQKYDIIVGNLETNISTPGLSYAAPGKLYTFNAPIKSIDTLVNAGIKVVSLANNHTMDYYAKGLTDQINLLEEKGVITFGAGNNINEAFLPKYLIYNDVTIALIGFNDIENWQSNPTETSAGSAYFNDELMKTAVTTANEKADIVIVFPHWGGEYLLTHHDRQEKYGKLFIDWGADVVIGAHPHVIQDVQEYNGKMIYYSLGNFLFDWMNSIPNASKSMMVELIIKDKEIDSSSTIRTKLNSRGWPELDI